MSYGIRYIVIGVGAPDDPAEDADVGVVFEVVQATCPFKVTVLSERVSDRLTVELIREAGGFTGV